MDILAALRQAEAKLKKQADRVRHQLDAVRSAMKVLGRGELERVNGLARRNG